MREVLKMIEKVSGVKLKIEEGPRRAGDPVQLVAEAGKIRAALGWRQEHDDLERICASAYRWELGMRKPSPERRRNVAA